MVVVLLVSMPLAGCTRSSWIEVENSCGFDVTATWSPIAFEQGVVFPYEFDERSVTLAPSTSGRTEVEIVGGDAHLLLRHAERGIWMLSVPVETESSGNYLPVVLKGEVCSSLLDWD
jgi:hypothetical protein